MIILLTITLFMSHILYLFVTLSYVIDPDDDFSFIILILDYVAFIKVMISNSNLLFGCLVRLSCFINVRLVGLWFL
jgi:hypothetical protein